MLSERKYKHHTFIFKTAYDQTTILLETNFWVAMKYTLKEKVVRHNVCILNMLKYYFKRVKHLSIQGTTKIQIGKSGTATDFYQ